MHVCQSKKRISPWGIRTNVTLHWIKKSQALQMLERQPLFSAAAFSPPGGGGFISKLISKGINFLVTVFSLLRLGNHWSSRNMCRSSLSLLLFPLMCLSFCDLKTHFNNEILLSTLLQATSRRRASSPVPRTVNSASGPTGLAAASRVAAGSKFAPSGSERSRTTGGGRAPSWTTSTRYTVQTEAALSPSSAAVSSLIRLLKSSDSRLR